MSATMLSHVGRRFRLPLATDSLDGAITLNTIYFIHELNVAFAELARVTKRSGRVVIGLGDPDAMAGSPMSAHNFRLRSVPEVINLLQDAGLTVEEERRVGEGERAFRLLVAKPSQSPL